MNRVNCVDVKKMWEVAEAAGVKTQASLAERSGITPSALRRVLNGNGNIRTLIKIADALDVEPRDLLIKPIKEDEK